MAIVKGTAAALSSPDRFDLVDRGFGWEILDKKHHRIVSMHFDEAEARAAYAMVSA
jgi:hypothetical protein